MIPYPPLINIETYRPILERHKLTKYNFVKWYRQLRMVLDAEDKLKYVDQPLPTVPPYNAPTCVRDSFAQEFKQQESVGRLMLCSMNHEIQEGLRGLNAYDILHKLKAMFQQQVDQELLKTVKAFHASKHKEGLSVNFHLIEMEEYLDHLEFLGHPMPHILGVSLILTSLSKDYEPFVLDYKMHSMGKTISDLHAKLVIEEHRLANKKAQKVLAVRAGSIHKTKPKPQALGKGYRGKDKQTVTYTPKEAFNKGSNIFLSVRKS